MSDLIIIGGGGHAKSVADLALRNDYNIVGFLDDYDTDIEIFGAKRLGKISECEKFAQGKKFIIAIGNNAFRKKICETYKLDYATLVHPSAIIAREVVIEEGTVVFAGAIINAYTKISKHTIINTGAVVEHDCVVGEFSMVAPRTTICGVSKIGNNCWIGAGSVVNNGISICDNVIVGSGAAVVKNIEEAGTYVGVPAKKIK
ncbi:MAG: acetyltransferase [Ruminococcaceae bacterium]|nr:acetyltransferase [Oscillospiraceae bacterium]